MTNLSKILLLSLLLVGWFFLPFFVRAEAYVTTMAPCACYNRLQKAMDCDASKSSDPNSLGHREIAVQYKSDGSASENFSTSYKTACSNLSNQYQNCIFIPQITLDAITNGYSDTQLSSWCNSQSVNLDKTPANINTPGGTGEQTPTLMVPCSCFERISQKLLCTKFEAKQAAVRLFYQGGDATQVIADKFKIAYAEGCKKIEQDSNKDYANYSCVAIPEITYAMTQIEHPYPLTDFVKWCEAQKNNLDTSPAKSEQKPVVGCFCDIVNSENGVVQSGYYDSSVSKMENCVDSQTSDVELSRKFERLILNNEKKISDSAPIVINNSDGAKDDAPIFINPDVDPDSLMAVYKKNCHWIDSGEVGQNNLILPDTSGLNGLRKLGLSGTK